MCVSLGHFVTYKMCKTWKSMGQIPDNFGSWTLPQKHARNEVWQNNEVPRGAGTPWTKRSTQIISNQSGTSSEQQTTWTQMCYLLQYLQLLLHLLLLSPEFLDLRAQRVNFGLQLLLASDKLDTLLLNSLCVKANSTERVRVRVSLLIDRGIPSSLNPCDFTSCWDCEV